jgi:hypothetical protein
LGVRGYESKPCLAVLSHACITWSHAASPYPPRYLPLGKFHRIQLPGLAFVLNPTLVMKNRTDMHPGAVRELSFDFSYMDLKQKLSLGGY